MTEYDLDVVDSSTFSQLAQCSLKRTFDMFAGNHGLKPQGNPEATQSKLKIKLQDEYTTLEIPEDKDKFDKYENTIQSNSTATSGLNQGSFWTKPPNKLHSEQIALQLSNSSKVTNDLALSNFPTQDQSYQPVHAEEINKSKYGSSNELSTLQIRRAIKITKPVPHLPWKLYRVISGHQGWVQCLAMDPSNEWFASAGNDRLIKFWDLATGTLKLTLTGHVNTIRDMVVSDRHPYLFSCAEDNRVKCWDLEHNKVIRDYHGHLSGVYCLTLHPALDILATGGRDAVVRVWDLRTKQAIHVFSGHSGTIMSLKSQKQEPQLISGSQDKMVRLWDLTAGKCSVVLTNHKKSIRSLAIHPKEYAFCSCAADNIKVWRCPLGRFDRNIQGHNSILNCCAIKENNDDSSVLVAGSNSGQLHFWDWRSGQKFDTIQSRVQPGSLESENGIFACIFDRSETRLITGECDKTIKFWKEDEDATPGKITTFSKN